MGNVIATYWAIRHKPSGLYLPKATGRMNRGGSFVEPSKGEPRLFVKETWAKTCLTIWLKGKQHHYYYELEFDEGIRIEHIPSRVREEMEVIPLYLTERA